MKRRHAVGALLALGACAGFPAVASRPFRIGFLIGFPSKELRAAWSALMGEHGWKETRDFVIVESGLRYDPAWAEEAVKRVLEFKPDLIWAVSTAYAVAAHRLTKTIPIVMRSSGYPVEAGLAQSLARPGKNVTGNSNYAGTGIWGKLLELLRDVKPGVKRVGMLWTYVPPAFPREEIEAAYGDLRSHADALGLALHRADAATSEGLPQALRELAAFEPDALLLTSASTWKEWQTVMQFCVNRKLPTIMDSEELPGARGRRPLMSLAPTWLDMNRRAVAYVDRILRGAKAGDLPIQLPAKLQLTLNLRTAREIGLAIPPPILLRADRVIE